MLTAAVPAWASETSLDLPAIDIVSFTFANRGEHDWDKPIFISAKDPTKYITTSQAYEVVQRLCKGLVEIAIRPGACVTICSPNHILYPLIWLGIIGAGGVVAGVNPALTVPELKHHLNVTGTSYLIIHQSCRTNIVVAAVECGIPATSIFLFDDDVLSRVSYAQPPSPVSIDSQDQHNEPSDLIVLLEQGQLQWGFPRNVMMQPALHATTSGTTGLPKAAVLPHQYLVSQALMLEEQYKSRARQTSQLICLPIFHTFAGNAALVLPLRLGITTYFLPRFQIDDFTEAVSRFAITDAPVVPPIVSALVQRGGGLGQKLRSLRRLICAGAPMNLQVQNALYQYLNNGCRISQCWGTTETGWVTLTPATELDRSGSVGRLTANTQLKLVSADGSVISKEGEHGEALVKTPSLFLGYRNNAEASSSALDIDGYYHTGDRAYYKDGKVFIEGRIKDIMKVNGWQVSPEELEEKIISHPGIADCAVVGYTCTDPTGLQQTVPRAYVVRAPNSAVNESDICSLVARQTISYKHLKGGVIFVDSIPRNPAGKILRRLLI